MTDGQARSFLQNDGLATIKQFERYGQVSVVVWGNEIVCSSYPCKSCSRMFPKQAGTPPCIGLFIGEGLREIRNGSPATMEDLFITAAPASDQPAVIKALDSALGPRANRRSIERDLDSRVRSGGEAHEWLFEMYIESGHLKRILRKKYPNAREETLEDAVAAGYQDAIDGMRNHPATGSCGGYLALTCSREYLKQIGIRGGERVVPKEVPMEEDLIAISSNDDPNARIPDIDLHMAIPALPERPRRVIWRFFFEGKSKSQIAREMGVSDAQVHRWFKQALQILGKKLGD